MNVMKQITQPKFESLTQEQLQLVASLMEYFRQAKFSNTKLNSPLVIQNVVNSIASVCKNDEDLSNFIDFVGQMVRWYRLPGLYLAFYLQLYTQTYGDWLSHIKACLIYSDAQINLNYDLALDSTEVAYNTFLKVKKKLDLDSLPSSLVKAIPELEKIFVSRLSFFHSFFSQGCKPFRPSECNPITDSLYYSLTHKTLELAFPELDFKNENKIETTYLSIIQQCQHNDVLYYQILARRFLGVWYLGNNKVDNSIEQLKLGLNKVMNIDLEAEAGHFHRLLGYALLIKGELKDAAEHMYKAYKIDAPTPVSYWRSIDARELASIVRRAAVLGIELPIFSADSQELLQKSAEYYRIGRFLFDAHIIEASELPISKAIKLQMFRSYSENAIDQALVTNNLRDVVEEIETNSPREIVQIVAELKAAQDMETSSVYELQKTREVFHRHLNTVPKTFEEYLTAFPEQYKSRHTYLQKVKSLKNLLTFSQPSANAVDQTLKMRVPNTNFLVFNTGRFSTYALINMANGNIKSDRAFFAESQLQTIHKEYTTKLNKLDSEENPKEQENLRKQAIDFLLNEYEKLLVPVLEPLMSEIKGSHLKVFPRLQMNAVPLHALKIGDKRLIEMCDVSYNQNLSLFLNLHITKANDSATSPLVVYNEEGTAGYLRGTLKAIEQSYKEKSAVLPNSTWLEILDAIKESETKDLFFACHGHYDTHNPSLSYLEVSNSEKVFFPKIFSDLNLSQYRSVVLGACESGLVKAELASEYIGLASAFLASGIQYFVGSLWEVSEFVTSILLSTYFELLSHNNCTLPQALNEAQRQLMVMSRDQVLEWVETKFSASAMEELKPAIEEMDDPPFGHPYYWAGFFVSGDV
jgi:CHAT domain-containing protein